MYSSVGPVSLSKVSASGIDQQVFTGMQLMVVVCVQVSVFLCLLNLARLDH